MKSSYTLIRSMLLSEKSSQGMEKFNQYAFKVEAVANKLEIKKAVEQIFNVHVVKVNTLNRQGKRKRERTMKYGRSVGHKRAIVTLKAGEKIDVI